MAVTDYATVPHYFLPPEDDWTDDSDCAAPGCDKKPLDPIHGDPSEQDGPQGGVAAASDPRFGDVG